MRIITRQLPYVVTLGALAAIGILMALHVKLALQPPPAAPSVVAPQPPPPRAPVSPAPPTDTLDSHGCRVLPDGLRICPMNGAEAASGKPRPAPGRRFPRYTEIERPPRAEAVRVVDWIVRIAGVARNFEVIEGEFKGGWIALAGMHERRRYLIYDRKMFDWADGRVRWRHVAIMAHEIAHHLNGDTTGTHGAVHDHEEELAADYFAGFVVARLGGTLDQALSMTDILSERASKTHPARADRRVAVTEGWDAGNLASDLSR